MLLCYYEGTQNELRALSSPRDLEGVGLLRHRGEVQSLRHPAVRRKQITPPICSLRPLPLRQVLDNRVDRIRRLRTGGLNSRPQCGTRQVNRRLEASAVDALLYFGVQ
jgi:hypothetical protein